jgi:flagellin-like protein
MFKFYSYTPYITTSAGHEPATDKWSETMNYLSNATPVKTSKGQSNIFGVIITLLVGILLIVAVLFPVTSSIVASSGATGSTKTIMDQIPLLVGVMAIVLVAGAMIAFM